MSWKFTLCCRQVNIGIWDQGSARDRDRVPENFQSPEQSPKVKSRNPSSRKSKSRSPIPDFSILSPGPRSRKFWILVPVRVTDFKMSSGSASRFPKPGLRMPTHIWDFKITFENLIFFSKNVFGPYEKTRRVGHKNWSLRSLTLILDF